MKYPYKKLSYSIDEEDFFHNLVLYCIEANRTSYGGTFRDRACHIIETELRKQRQETCKLYNPHKNLYLNKCYGESKEPLGDWMNFTVNEDAFSEDEDD